LEKILSYRKENPEKMLHEHDRLRGLGSEERLTEQSRSKTKKVDNDFC